MSGQNNENGKKKSNRRFPVLGLAAIILACGILTGCLGYILSNDSIIPAGKPMDSDPNDAIAASTADERKRLLNSDVIYDNIFVNDIQVSGLSKDAAAKKIKNSLKSGKTVSIVLTDGSEQYVLDEPGTDDAAIEKAVAEAFNYGRSGTDAVRYETILNLKNEKHVINAELMVDRDSDITKQLSQLKTRLDIEPVDATMTRTDGEFTVVPDKPGRGMSVEETREAILDALSDSDDGGEITVAIVFNETLAKISAADVSKATSLLGTFTTHFVPSSGDRNINIQVAAEKINDYVVAPGEVFSTNDAFGPSTYENGYRLAPIILSGQLVQGIGGGMCQVSSTLYMALLNAEMEIVERRNHSLRVAYMEGGFDATLVEGVIDLKFKNTSAYPVTIESYFAGTKGVLTINVYGYENRPVGRKLKFESALISSRQPEVEILEDDPTLPLGEREVKIAAKTGYTYNLYKLIYENDKLIERVQVNTSVYSPVRGVVKVGTGPAAENPEGTDTTDTDTTDTDTTETVNPDTTETQETPVTTETPVATETPVSTETPVPTETPTPVAENTPDSMTTPVIDENAPVIDRPAA